MDIHIKPQSAARRAWWLCWGVLWALGLLLCLPTSSQAQTSGPFDVNPIWQAGGNAFAWSVAWGDVDNDGDLDLATGGNDRITLYLNRGGILQSAFDQPLTIAVSPSQGFDLAWGDVNNDGYLDLAVAGNQQAVLIKNQGGRLVGPPIVIKSVALSTRADSVAWGDVDGDGYLDLALGTGGWLEQGTESLVEIYKNQNGALQTTPIWTTTVAPVIPWPIKVAWGDVDGDGILNLAVAAGKEVNLYRFPKDAQGGIQYPITAALTITSSENVNSIAWGDVNQDQHLDLAVGKYGVSNPSDSNRIFLWQNGQIDATADWSSSTAYLNQELLWGDVNADGLLDLVSVQYQDQHVVFFGQQSGLLDTTGLRFDSNSGSTTDGALGDLNGDGMLDLATSENGGTVFINNVSRLPISKTPQRIGSVTKAKAVAWGDVDNDGDLDLAVSSGAQAVLLYRNSGQQLEATASLTATVPNSVGSLAWGDANGDGFLDLAVASLQFPNGNTHLFYNSGGQLQTAPGWTSPSHGYVQNMAWGDVDGDGDLDLAVAHRDSSPAVIYLNVQGQLQGEPGWHSPEASFTEVAWGDVDGDGDLDLAFSGAWSSAVYRNNGIDSAGKPQLSKIWQPATPNWDQSLAWGDVDGDGDLDLAIGTVRGHTSIYYNQNGQLSSQPDWQSADFNSSSGLAWADADGDGDLDLATAGYNGLKVYLNEQGRLQTAASRSWVLAGLTRIITAGGEEGVPLAWGDVNQDGALDLAVAGDIGRDCCIDFSGVALYVNQRPASVVQGFTTQNTAVTIKLDSEPVPSFSGQSVTSLAPANFYASPVIRSSIIPIKYVVKGSADAVIQEVRGFYSPDGGGRWYPAVATSDTITQELAASPSGTAYLFKWDVGRSGFLGQSDNVVFRIQALPSMTPAANEVAGPYQLGSVAVQTFPFRVRGTQVRVLNSEAGNSTPVMGGLLYKLPTGQATGALPIADQAGTPYNTGGQGYLQGRSQLASGDRLVALAPITATESYTLYNMSAAPTLNGLHVYTVTSAGVQTLTVSAANPLLLFNLDVALEWDVRKDSAFLNQLQFDLRRTSEFLFDATDGQAALGGITLYHNKEQWERADIRIYASNALIPNADPGGIVTSEVNELIASNPFIGATTPYSITYQPGRIRIGAVWNRFGEATGTLGEDWPRTLAHELGHYAFYLYDNYLGLQNGVVVPVTTCTGTLMTDQYREDFSEFRTAASWATDCAQTVSAQRSGRADWQTITRFYPWLKAPSAQANPGPATLPLAVTQVEQRFVATPTLPIDVAVFDLVAANGAAQLSGPHAQAVLYSSDGRLLDLGHPVVDKLEARGAHVGDRLCVYDPLEQRLGCETVAANDNFLTLVAKPAWQPEIVVSPVTSRTVSVLVSNVAAGLTLQGKLYPENSLATPATPFVPWAGGFYSTTFQLSAGVLAGHIQVWVEEADSAANPRRESLTSYALGGSPGKIKKPPKSNKRSLGLTTQTGSEQVTPAIAPDGQVLIYGNVSFSDGEFYALQKVNRLPTPPLWTTVVGDGYRILRSANAPDLVNTSILFRYRGQDVPAGEENFLSLYFWNEPARRWDKLPTVLNKAVNEASAQAPGPGLYVLMSSLEIPLRRLGWNLVAYPVQETRAVSTALASLGNGYSTVYGYTVTDGADPWKVYAPTAPRWVNDLTQLEFSQGYWINVSKPMTWLVKGPDDPVQAASTHSLPTPPATYYGVVLPTAGFVPAAGLPVQALLNGVVCGSGVTQAVDGQIVYTLNVVGDGSRPGCLGAGQPVSFTVAETAGGSAPWQNDTVQMVNFGVRTTIYLPEIHK